jgi:Protein of unknown function (DUF4240)
MLALRSATRRTARRSPSWPRTCFRPFPQPEIVGTEPVLLDLMAASYRTLPWAAACLINGGCSDDGFDYLRGWRIVQGREVFERSMADPDSLADLPVIGPPRIGRPPIECEDALYIVMRAHKAATGEELPANAFTIRRRSIVEPWHAAARRRASTVWAVGVIPVCPAIVPVPLPQGSSPEFARRAG